jgi:hypothetical protein
MKNLFIILYLCLLYSCQIRDKQTLKIEGELRQWHEVTLLVNGPETAEWGKENPFLDYRLEATFTGEKKSFTVPGFFAADGNAAETSADKGNVWKIRFRPDATGTWNYKISFRKGKDIVVKEREYQGEAVSGDGMEGSFDIVASNKSGNDFRNKGRIVNGGRGYFRYQDSDEIWIKNGADSPENFLAYTDFDQTSRFSLKTAVREGEADPKKSLHKYEPHVADWKNDDPTWQHGKGKGIIGALNYLNSAGVNSVYMLTLNILGDGKDVWPYSDHNERYRFDCSKLDQWEIVFDHMDRLGMMIHFVLQETENECLLDNGGTDVQRKLYLHELVARFGHHPAVTWNIGEENGPAGWTPIGQTDDQRKAMMSYIKQINPYPNIVVLHTHSDVEHQDLYLNPQLGFENLDGPSLQIGNPSGVNNGVYKWITESEKAGKRWLVNLDEIGPSWKGIMPDSHDALHDTVRYECLWGTLLAGGAGVEWYFGYRYPHNDLICEDFRSRDNWWKQSAIATRFMLQFPLEEMSSNNSPVKIKGAFCMEKPGEIYLVYLPAGTKNARISLTEEKNFSVRWFNPRSGGELIDGTVSRVQGKGFMSLGDPPYEPEKDWVVVVQKLLQ